jgi:hypothetical protein
MGKNGHVAVAGAQRPIRLLVRDDELRRNRLTVFFRLLLAIPPFVWLTLWGIAAFFAAIALWLSILVQGTAPEILHDFVAGWVRYAVHVYGYVLLAADPYPWFRGSRDYPIDVEIDPPVRQSRWTGFFRLLLALPALLLAAVLVRRLVVDRERRRVRSVVGLLGHRCRRSGRVPGLVRRALPRIRSARTP